MQQALLPNCAHQHMLNSWGHNTQGPPRPPTADFSMMPGRHPHLARFQTAGSLVCSRCTFCIQRPLSCCSLHWCHKHIPGMVSSTLFVSHAGAGQAVRSLQHLG